MSSRDVYGVDFSVLWIQQCWICDGIVPLSGLWWVLVIMSNDFTLRMMILFRKHIYIWILCDSSTLTWHKQLAHRGQVMHIFVSKLYHQIMACHLPFVRTKMTQAIKNFPCGKDGHVDHTCTISWLLITFRCKKTRHQQAWFCPMSPFKDTRNGYISSPPMNKCLCCAHKIIFSHIK